MIGIEIIGRQLRPCRRPQHHINGSSTGKPVGSSGFAHPSPCRTQARCPTNCLDPRPRYHSLVISLGPPPSLGDSLHLSVYSRRLFKFFASMGNTPAPNLPKKRGPKLLRHCPKYRFCAGEGRSKHEYSCCFLIGMCSLVIVIASVPIYCVLSRFMIWKLFFGSGVC